MISQSNDTPNIAFAQQQSDRCLGEDKESLRKNERNSRTLSHLQKRTISFFFCNFKSDSVTVCGGFFHFFPKLQNNNTHTESQWLLWVKLSGSKKKI